MVPLRRPPLVWLVLPPLVLTGLAGGATVAIHRLTGFDSHRFLLFNLLLAWIPFGLAGLLERLVRRRAVAGPLLLAWLLFLPNAPYLLTDLVHYGQLNPRAPRWLDLLALGAAAGAGLLLGLGSLLLVQLSVRRRRPRLSWPLVAVVLPTTSFGVYLGRVLRLNSWDALHPSRLALGLGRLAEPAAHPLMIAGVILLSAFLALGYAAYYRLALGPTGRRA